MSEPIRYIYSHKDLVATLIKDKGIHAGLWVLTVQFGLGATNVASSEDQNNVNPAAIVPVLNIGILEAETKTGLTVDAAEVNPAPGAVRPTGNKKAAPKAASKKTATKKR